MIRLICRFCGRQGPAAGYVKMANGHYRCKAGGACQRRIRSQVHQAVAGKTIRRPSR